jgi:hypothetical protein
MTDRAGDGQAEDPVEDLMEDRADALAAVFHGVAAATVAGAHRASLKTCPCKHATP